jgi:hypothetical protein
VVDLVHGDAAEVDALEQRQEPRVTDAKLEADARKEGRRILGARLPVAGGVGGQVALGDVLGVNVMISAKILVKLHRNFGGKMINSYENNFLLKQFKLSGKR